MTITSDVRFDPRTTFAHTALDILAGDPSAALVYAVIGRQYFDDADPSYADRIIDVGIREQLLVNVGAGLALSGMRPIVHSFAPFLIERAYEQITLGFSHNDVAGVLVSTGASADMANAGATHQSIADVALMTTVPGFSVHVPGHANEVAAMMRSAYADGGRHYIRVEALENSHSYEFTDGQMHVVRQSRTGPVVIAVGPMLDIVLRALDQRAATVIYASTVYPLDGQTLRAVLPDRDVNVVIVEPYLAGTSAAQINPALADISHRSLSLGFPRAESRHYGSTAEHFAEAGLDESGIRAAIDQFAPA